MRSAHAEMLFVYGTLRDPEVQTALFGRKISGDVATLKGWSVYRSESDGFLFIKPDPRDCVVGLVLRLSPDELRIADAWEDVPHYRRERLTARSDGVVMEAWTYTRREGEGVKHETSTTSGHKREQVIEWAQRMRAEMS